MIKYPDTAPLPPTPKPQCDGKNHLWVMENEEESVCMCGAALSIEVNERNGWTTTVLLEPPILITCPLHVFQYLASSKHGCPMCWEDMNKIFTGRPRRGGARLVGLEEVQVGEVILPQPPQPPPPVHLVWLDYNGNVMEQVGHADAQPYVGLLPTIVRNAIDTGAVIDINRPIGEQLVQQFPEPPQAQQAAQAVRPIFEAPPHPDAPF